MPRSSRAIALFTLLLACGGPPPPTAIEASINPSRVWYHTGQNVTLTGLVTNVLEEEITDIEVSWTVEPADAATLGTAPADPRQAAFRLARQGTATFTGCVVIPGEAEPSLCDSLTVRIDDGMPMLEVTSPTPGQELLDSGEGGILVRGSVTDAGSVNVFVNGLAADLTPVGEFSVSLIPSFGVNHIVVNASDGVTDVSRVEMDVLWAPGYQPALSAEGLPELTLNDGMAIWLGQDFFDDELPLDSTLDPVQTRDLADLLELVIGHLQLGSVIPDPAYQSGDTIVLHVTRAELGEPHVEIDLTDTGADLFLRIAGVEVDTTGTLDIGGTCDPAPCAGVPLDGTVTASAVAFARLTMRKDSETAPLEISLGDVQVGLESVQGAFVDPDANALFRALESLLRSSLEGVLLGSVDMLLTSSVPALLEDTFLAIDGALAGRELPLNQPPFPPVTIRIDGRIRDISTVFRREMVTTMRMTVGTDVPSIHTDSLGVPMIEPVEMTPTFFRDGSLQLAVRLTLLNALLHSLWSSGLLDVDIGGLLPSSVSGLVTSARLEGRLPPVLRPPRPEEPYDLMLSLGQLELPLTFNGAPVRFAVSLEAGVDIDAVANRISINVSETPTIHVWTVEEPADASLLTPELLHMLLVDLWPDLRAGLVNSLSFELPLPALGDVGGLAPELTNLTLSIDMLQRVRPRGSVLLLDAQMLGTLAPTP